MGRILKPSEDTVCDTARTPTRTAISAAPPCLGEGRYRRLITNLRSYRRRERSRRSSVRRLFHPFGDWGRDCAGAETGAGGEENSAHLCRQSFAVRASSDRKIRSRSRL